MNARARWPPTLRDAEMTERSRARLDNGSGMPMMAVKLTDQPD
jgi:hypothetical protein